MKLRQIFTFVFPCTALVLSLAAFDAPTSEWHLTGPYGGSASSLAIDPQKPDTLLAGAQNSLVYRSSDAGDSWSLLDFPKHHLAEVTSVLIDPTNSNHYLAGIISADGGGILSSHDQGKTWKPVKDVKGFGVRSIVYAPSKPNRLISGTLRGVMLSDDAGDTWTRVSPEENREMQGITATAIDPKDPDVMYAGTSHLPWKSVDGGKTWHSIHDGMTDDSDVFSIYVNPADPQNIFASACSGIYTSPNRGDRWKKVMGLTFSQRRTHVIRKDPQVDGTIYAGTTMGLFKSPNMGNSWKLLTKEQVNAVVFDPVRPGSMYMAMEYEGLSRATDTGEKISMLNRGFIDRPISSAMRAGDKLVALETQLDESSGLFVSRDKGESWSQLNGVRGLNSVHLRTIASLPSAENVWLGAAPRGSYKSVDGGMSWRPLPIRLSKVSTPAAAPARKGTKAAAARKAPARKPVETFQTITLEEIFGLYATKDTAHDIIFAATNLGLYKSADAGERWTAVEVAGAAAVTGLYIAPSADGRMVARTNAGLFLSKDFGDHWTALPFSNPAEDVNEVAVPGDPTAPILVATRIGLFATSDEGAKWKKNPGGIPGSTVTSVVYGAGQLAYANQYGKLFQSINGGESWQQLPSSYLARGVRRLWIPDPVTNKLYALTTDLGVLARN